MCCSCFPISALANPSMNISRNNVGIVDSVIVRSFFDSAPSVAGTCSTPPSSLRFALSLLGCGCGVPAGCVWYVSAAERTDDPAHSLSLLKVFTTFDTITCPIQSRVNNVFVSRPAGTLSPSSSLTRPDIKFAVCRAHSTSFCFG